MIERLKVENWMDLYEFLGRVKDSNKDIYVISKNERYFLKNNLKLIQKVVKEQEIYILREKEIEGIYILYREKGFRLFLKILSEKREVISKLLKHIVWNHNHIEMYIKTKKFNQNIDMFKRFGFIVKGLRDNDEIMLFRPKKEKIPYVTDDNK